MVNSKNSTSLLNMSPRSCRREVSSRSTPSLKHYLWANRFRKLRERTTAMLSLELSKKRDIKIFTPWLQTLIPGSILVGGGGESTELKIMQQIDPRLTERSLQNKIGPKLEKFMKKKWKNTFVFAAVLSRQSNAPSSPWPGYNMSGCGQRAACLHCIALYPPR